MRDTPVVLGLLVFALVLVSVAGKGAQRPSSSKGGSPKVPQKNGGEDVAGSPAAAGAQVGLEFNPAKDLAEEHVASGGGDRPLAASATLPGDEDALIASCLEENPIPTTLVAQLSTLSASQRQSWDYKTYSRFDWCSTTPPDTTSRLALAKFCNCVGGTTSVNPNAALSPEEKAAALAASAKRQAIRLQAKARKFLATVGPGILEARRMMNEIIYSKEHQEVAADLDELNGDIKESVSDEKVKEGKMDKQVYMQYSGLSQQVAAEARKFDSIHMSSTGERKVMVGQLKKLLGDFVHANQVLNVLKVRILRVFKILGIKDGFFDGWDKHEKVAPPKPKDPTHYAVGKLRCTCRDVNPKDQAHKVCLCRKKSAESQSDKKKEPQAPSSKAAKQKAAPPIKSVKLEEVNSEENVDTSDNEVPIPRFTRFPDHASSLDVGQHNSTATAVAEMETDDPHVDARSAIVSAVSRKANRGSATINSSSEGDVYSDHAKVQQHDSGLAQEKVFMNQSLLQLQENTSGADDLGAPGCQDSDDEVMMEMEIFYD